MKRLAGLVVGVWGLAAVASAGAAAAKPSTAAPPVPTPTPTLRTETYIVARRRATLHYGNDPIGELPEGTRVRVIREAGQWLQVRAEFGKAWIRGWVHGSFLVPDSLAKVDVEVGRAALEHTFERRNLPGYQFLIARVRFTPKEDSPSRIYFEWADAETADVYLVHSRDKKVVPYGYMQRQGMSDRREFVTEDKHQVLMLKQGEPLVETYVIAVPQRARRFELTLKDIKRPVQLRR